MEKIFFCPFVGAPVRPNMLNMPKSASVCTQKSTRTRVRRRLGCLRSVSVRFSWDVELTCDCWVDCVLTNSHYSLQWQAQIHAPQLIIQHYANKAIVHIRFWALSGANPRWASMHQTMLSHGEWLWADALLASPLPGWLHANVTSSINTRNRHRTTRLPKENQAKALVTCR